MSSGKLRRTGDVLQLQMGTLGFHSAYGMLGHDMIIMIKVYCGECLDKPDDPNYLSCCFFNARADMQLGDYAEAIRNCELIAAKEPYWLDAAVIHLHAANIVGDTKAVAGIFSRFREIGEEGTLLQTICGDDPNEYEKKMRSLFPGYSVSEIRKLLDPGDEPKE